MPSLAIPIENAIPFRRPKGSQVTFINQSATDVYFDFDSKRLNSSVPGTTPNGTKIAASGGQIQIQPFPGEVWFRAATATTLEVQP